MRQKTISASAINIRITDDEKRDYVYLLDFLANLNVSAKVWGNKHLAITSFNTRELVGVFSTFSEIDSSGEWFNISRFTAAEETETEEINIPEHLRPDHNQAYFKLNPNLHIISYISKSTESSLSPRFVEKYFRSPDILRVTERVFGPIEVNVVKDFDTLDTFFEGGEIAEIDITVYRPNPDQLDPETLRDLEERFKQENAERIDERLKGRSSGGLTPSSRTLKLADVAAENGRVRGVSYPDGTKTMYDTDAHPLQKSERFDSDTSERTALDRLSKKLADDVRRVRER